MKQVLLATAGAALLALPAFPGQTRAAYVLTDDGKLIKLTPQ